MVQFRWENLTVGDGLWLLELHTMGATPDVVQRALLALLERVVPGGIRAQPLSMLACIAAQFLRELPDVLTRKEQQEIDTVDLLLGGKALARYSAPAPAWLS